MSDDPNDVVDLRALATQYVRVESAMMARLDPARLRPRPIDYERGFIPFKLEEVRPAVRVS
jgi:hypothetical protein